MLLAKIIHYSFSLYSLGLLAYVLCSWFAHPMAYAVRSWLARWYEPILEPIRTRIPAPQFGYVSMDLSPVLLFVGLALLKSIILSLLLPPF
jgi:uncharacterized protein YggT (Ycf19 family)